MKKLVFAGISLFCISVCVGELWGDMALRDSRRLSKSSQNLQSKNSRSNKNSTSARNISKNRKKSTGKNSGNLNSVRNSAPKQNTKRNTTARNGTVSQNSDANFSKLKLEDNVAYILKNIIGNIPSTDIRALMSNMDILSRSLRSISEKNRGSRRNRDNDVEIVIKKMKDTSDCLDELLRVKSNLYLELFNQREERANLPDSVSIDRIIDSLERVDTKKFGEIISLCVQKKLSTRVINDLKAFSRKFKETKKILGEIKKEFSKTILSQLEGLPELKNLEATNTAANRRLANRREELEENRIYEDNLNEENDSEDNSDQGRVDEYSPNETDSQVESEEKIDEEFSNVPQKESKRRPEQKPEYGKIGRINEDSGKDSSDEENKQKEKRIINIWKSKAAEKRANVKNELLNESPNEGQSEIVNDSEGKNRLSSSGGLEEEEDSGEKLSQENNNSEQPKVQNAQQRPEKKEKPVKIAENANEQSAFKKSNQKKSQKGKNNSNEHLSQEHLDQIESLEDENDSDEQLSQERPNRIGTQEDENNFNESLSLKKPVQAMQEDDEKDSNDDESAEESSQMKPQKDENISDEQVSAGNSGRSNQAGTVVKDLNGIENPEKFYQSLETNIGLLYERDFTNKQKVAYKKIQGYLKETKSERSFEQKVSDADRIVKAYNSLVALKPKTKKGESLPLVRRSKIKSLQEKIYIEVFDNLSTRIRKLQSNKKLNNSNMKKDFKKVLVDNEKNKEKFKQSKSGREKRQIMIDSAEAYDRLMEKIWQHPELIKTKRDREEFDRIGYTLDPVILSIDVNPSRDS